ncbi:C-signal-like [Ambystoma mexicanum]|uniref:C-signal-like n=1 Tax=Ambystoma mexicanum TaxID=8296 RepID=UPI0037E97F3C
MAWGARTVLITGCNRGIGLELVRQLLAKPSAPQKIFATCRNPDSPQCQALNELASKHCNLVVIKLEVTDDKSAKEAAEAVEKHLNGAGLNVLINNAGIMHPSTLETADAKDMLDVYATNVVGPLLVAKAFLPLLKKSAKENAGASMGCGKAALVNVSTLLGSVEKNHLSFGFVPVLSYRCSKAALNMLTNCQSYGYKADGIMCTALHPGWVKTDLGGSEADLTVEQSVEGIVNVLNGLNESHNGILIDWNGKTIPW